MNAAPAFAHVAIIGFGLIGASLARALRKQQMTARITACDTLPEYLDYARSEGLADATCASPAEAVREADLVLIATPPAAFGAVAQSVAPALKRGALVMDMGSVKEAAMAAIAPHIPATATYIPCHPIAGREQSGPEAALADLFEGRRVVLTPAPDVREHALHTAMLFWQALGAKPEAIPADLHDAIYAAVSHLPQLIAFAALPVVAPMLANASGFPLFQRFTRLGHSNPVLWAQIFTFNAKPLRVVLDLYLQGVYQIVSELRGGEAEKSLPTPEEAAFCRMVLFPRVAASCLVGAVMTAERKMGVKLARYAGSGFADLAAPAVEAPEEDLKQISNYATHMADLLEEFMARLNDLQGILPSNNTSAMEEALRKLQNHAKKLA